MSEEGGLNAEVRSLKELLSNSKEELKQRDGKIRSLEMEVENVRKLKSELAAKDSMIDRLRNELKQATGAEETSKKAMDELAIALNEVAAECKQMKEKHQSTLLEIQHVKEESEQLKNMVRSIEGRYGMLLDEAKKETELYRNTADRLRSEAEESLLAWNEKEKGFVTWIKTTEEEKAVVEEDLKAAEILCKSAKDEIFKLRDILKQAISEANAAKAAADIAREENSLLKDFLSGKDEALLVLNKENERLRINEVVAKGNLKDFKHSETEDDQDGARETTKPKDPEKVDALGGTILFSDYSPNFELRTPIADPSIGKLNSENHGSVDSHHLHNSDSGWNNIRRKKPLFHRVSDMIMKKKMVH